MSGHAAAIEMLVQSGSKAIDTPNEGSTPMHLAARNGHVGVVAALVRFGSTAVNTLDSESKTPLHLAVEHGDPALVELIIRSGCRYIDYPDKDGQVPVCLAAQLNYPDVIETLVRLGSTWLDICNPDDMGVVLHTASIRCIKVFKILSAKSYFGTVVGVTSNEASALAIRFRVYFAHSLTYRLLFELDYCASASSSSDVGVQAARPGNKGHNEFGDLTIDAAGWEATEFDFSSSAEAQTEQARVEETLDAWNNEMDWNDRINDDNDAGDFGDWQ